ncbi:nucleotidyltransferase [Streptomyces sp. NPDC048636]|uniref:nucleotidyltransferase domain-containing protein n=1 Tax=Streptomyces sp. NPDC048636 TaxID=3155762 RepID=UPI003428BF2C
MSALEETLDRYSKRSSDTEKEKQERAERMVRSAVNRWEGFDGIDCEVLPKGSYKNNTNVRSDSDVDIAVIHEGLFYYNDSALGEGDRVRPAPTAGKYFDGPGFRAELEEAMCDAYGGDCDTSGTTAIEIAENGGRVKADVVPSFRHRLYYYAANGVVSYHQGTRTWRTSGGWVVNYPEQQYTNGVAKNSRTGRRYKKMVRILKRVENGLVAAGNIDPLPSYFMECLVYCVPDSRFNSQGVAPLTDDFTGVVRYIWNQTKPGGEAKEWLEPNEIKALFGDGQKWSMEDAHELSLRAWQRMGLGG